MTNPNKKDHWFRDMLTYGPYTGNFFLILMVVIVAISSLLLKLASKRNEVIIYTSQDQEYAEPIFQKFTDKTGIKVRPVYDNESAKTIGLVNRLIAEKNHPQCDVFWNNEESRTFQLGADGVLDERWSFGARTRRLVYNTNLVHNAPDNLSALTNETMRGKIALAYPLFGTTSTHFLVLRQRWGDARWKQWCRALAANKPIVVDGNSVVVKMVGKGEAQIGLTDSDDVAAGIREDLPISSVVLDKDGLLIRNSVAVVHGAPHSKNAAALAAFIRSPWIVNGLMSVGALDHGDGNPQIDWHSFLSSQDSALEFLKGLFLR